MDQADETAASWSEQGGGFGTGEKNRHESPRITQERREGFRVRRGLLGGGKKRPVDTKCQNHLPSD